MVDEINNQKQDMVIRAVRKMKERAQACVAVGGGVFVLSHFLLLGGTSSILRTFRGGTSRKKHPVQHLRLCLSVLIMYDFTQTQKYFTLALLVLIVTNIMSDINQ